MQTPHIIIALPSRLLAVALGECLEAQAGDISVCGTATDTREVFELLKKCPATALIYDPYLQGPGPEVMCCRLRREFPALKVILIKNPNANGRFTEAQSCQPVAIVSSETKPYELAEIIITLNTKQMITQNRKRSAETEQVETINKELLSQREKEITALITKGHSARQIAFALSITENTVRTHRQNILKKLGLNNKAQLVSWYLTTT